MQPPPEFLTTEECLEVDKALLTAHDKFSARVAIYALRSLKTIATQSGQAIADLHPDQITAWIEQDPSLQQTADANFRIFWSRLVLSSLNPLQQIVSQVGGAIEDLTVAQVVAWFEQLAKRKLDQN
jgi:hypothetical protein